MSGATPSLEAVLTGAAFMVCVVGLSVLIVLAIVIAIRAARRRYRTPSQAEALGQFLLDQFRGDYRMAWDEVIRIKAEHEMVERVAAQRAAGMTVVSINGGRLQ